MPFSTDAKTLLAADTEAHDNTSNASIILDHEEWHFAADGTLQHSIHLIYRVLTADGVENWSTIERNWEPWREKRPELRARVVTPDGTVHELDPKKIEDSPAGSGSPGTFSDARVLRCPLPAIAIGAVVEESITETVSPLPSGTVERRYIGWQVPVKELHLVVSYPEGTPFRFESHLLPSLKATEQLRDGRISHTYEARSLKPASLTPPLMPFDLALVPEVEFSTVRDWNASAAAYNEIVEKQLSGIDFSTEAAKARNGAKSRDEVVARLLEFIQKQVRYTGVEFSEAAIVPAVPTETLTRKYGDCKDKALLLVALLRAAKIPAHVALLNAGYEQDANVRIPGMDLFNHAIVFVASGGAGEQEYWIDVTAQYLRFGFVPFADQGRQALVIDKGTQSLRQIPESSSEVNTTVEKREFFLTTPGRSRVVETTSGKGESESGLRSQFGSADTEQSMKLLRSYLQAEYASESEQIKVEHPRADDFSKPFTLRLEIDKAARAQLSDLDGWVAIPLGSLLNGLPAALRTDKPDAAHEPGTESSRQSDFVLPAAYVAESQYCIHLPAGFDAKQLPQNLDQQLGPAHLTAKFKSDGRDVLATFRFDTVKRRYTASEAEDLRKAAVEILKQAPLPLVFESKGKTLLTEGKPREAVAFFKSLIDQDPKRALYHVQMSRVFSDAGAGEDARREARLATELEPASSAVWHNLGLTLSRDLIGRPFHHGFDLAGAEAAYRKGIQLDPSDATIQLDLAILLEHEQSGERYMSQRLNEVIGIYRGVKSETAKPMATQNLLYALAYARRFNDVKTEAEKLGPSALRSQMLLVVDTALSGDASSPVKQLAAAGLQEADQNLALQGASLILLRLRMYAQTASLLKASAQLFPSKAQEFGARGELLSKVKAQDTSKWNQKTPDGAFLSMIAAMTDGNFTANMPQFVAKEVSVTDDETATTFKAEVNTFKAVAQASGMSPKGMLDLVASLMRATVDSNPDGGARLRWSMPGAKISTLYFTYEDDKFKFIADNRDYSSIARHILNLAAENKLDAARKWLDWIREELKIAGGEDRFAGPVFPRLWNKGEGADGAHIRVAAAALIGGSKGNEALAILKGAPGTATDTTYKENLQLAYSRACYSVPGCKDGQKVAEGLAEKYSDSQAITGLVLDFMAREGNWSAYEALVNARLAKDPEEIAYRRYQAMAAAGQGHFEQAASLSLATAKSPKGEIDDWNSYGWNLLLAGTANAEKLKEVEQGLNAASTTSSRPGAPVLHTLAALYADVGRLTEARETILRVMAMWQMDEPNDQCWLVFGRVAEQVGANATAISDFERLKPPKAGPYANVSSYAIAHKRLVDLKAENHS